MAVETRRRTRICAATALAVSAMLVACSPPVKTRGHLPDKDVVAQLEPGRHDRNAVIDMLGSPSALSTFQDRTWYYVGSKSQQFAFFKPDILERKVLELSFDATDKLAQMEVYDLEDGQRITPVAQITPTEGKDLTILQQLLGNLGRFNSPGAGQQPAGSPGPGPSGPLPSPGG